MLQPSLEPWWPAVASAACCFVASLYCALHAPINDDDVYHLHSAWLVAHGALPYREFFEIHPPGMWLLLAPLVRWFSSPSWYLLTARVATALMFGAQVWLAARIVHVRAAAAALLTVLALGVMFRCQVWIFRAEFIAMLLFLLHLWLVAAARTSVWRTLSAAAAMSAACTISIRLLPFLAVQPLVVVWVQRRGWKRHAVTWIAGLLLGAGPAIVFLSTHDLWRDMWFWAFRFVGSSDVVVWSMQIGRAEVVLLGLGAASVALWSRDVEPRSSRRSALVIAWIMALVFHLANPQKVDYAALSLLVLTAMLLTTLVPLLARNVEMIRRDAAFITVAVGALFFVRLIVSIPNLADGETQRQQLRVLDWLHDVAGAEPVVLIAPYHPMTVRDASDLQNPGYYAFWISSDVVRRRLSHFAETLLSDPPPVIAADPWMPHTGGRDLPAWLNYAGVLTDAELNSVRTMLAARYAVVGFPLLSAAHNLPFGHRFWIREDRLAAVTPPRPFTLSADEEGRAVR